MTETHERTTPHEYMPEPVQADSPPIDANQSGALAIGLMVAIIVIVAMLTLALLISIP
jgi:hypothetical protein